MLTHLLCLPHNLADKHSSRSLTSQGKSELRTTTKHRVLFFFYSQLQLVPGPIVHQNDTNRQTDQVMNARPHPLPTNVPAATHSVNQVHIPQRRLQEQTVDSTYEEVPEVYY